MATRNKKSALRDVAEARLTRLEARAQGVGTGAEAGFDEVQTAERLKRCGFDGAKMHRDGDIEFWLFNVSRIQRVDHAGPLFRG